MGLHAKWDWSHSDWSEIMQQKLVTESGEIWDYATKIVDILLKGWHCLEEYVLHLWVKILLLFKLLFIF